MAWGKKDSEWSAHMTHPHFEVGDISISPRTVEGGVE